MSASLVALERPKIGAASKVFKSGPLFISSKGLGWKSWKKRWFILTRVSLVFFKNDPSALPQRGGEVNLILGGIDLNNSGSVVVREDKKLLTVLFPDGRDGRAFTLKAESLEDLYEWKTALEHALAQAPSATLVMGHNGIFRNDTNDSIEGSFHQWRDKRPVKSMRIMELKSKEFCDSLQMLRRWTSEFKNMNKARLNLVLMRMLMLLVTVLSMFFGNYPHLLFLHHAALQLLEAYKIDRKEVRVNAMHSAIMETFPEPNRHLLQRILKMMHTISLHASENRMTPSAVAACMAPLLLRPLLAGECELEDDFDINGDNSAQLLSAANAANNAQAIITTLLEEYENIFDDDNLHRCSISADSQNENSGSEDSTDDENMDIKDNGYHDAENEVDPETDDDPDRVLSGKLSESSGYAGSDLYDYKAFGVDDSDSGSPRDNITSEKKSIPPLDSQPLGDSNQCNEQQGQTKKSSETEMETPDIFPSSESHRSMGEILASMDRGLPQSVSGIESCAEKSISKPMSSNLNVKQSTFWGRSAGRKTPSMESIDSSGEEELAIQRLELTKNDLRQRITKEARGNAILQASLERRKQALHERRLALEQDVARLQEQLQAERDLRAALEVGLSMSSGQFSSSRDKG
ncbi:hypothetical protein F0562_001663 [Nyssa sinensis]|uniref:Rho-GAP domain-containing protein n=1 Tax=Nyssa sinensis TaxID=561372 RepID=A0A5J5C7M9_9ASTE|nr:hypothetical protein F0562_001663 [Nyssa sinensis]